MKRVLEIFQELSAIPRGSGNMEAISDFCVRFAQKRGLAVRRDEANNVVIEKGPTPGYENAPGIILQGHLDMVCQKEEGVSIDFEKDGIQTYTDGDFLKAYGTTLGADNGIAVAMALAILEREDLEHPSLEAVFTTDEEIGLLGAKELDLSLLKGKELINLDSEEDDVVTVSCAGGSNFDVRIPFEREEKKGDVVTVTLKGLQGGHSGVEIHKGRCNASVLAGRFLYGMKKRLPFSLISLSGGDKTNAIPRSASVSLLTENPKEFQKEAQLVLEEIKNEISFREPDFHYEIAEENKSSAWVVEEQTGFAVLSLLACVPDGVETMSANIPNLVETSLNLGIMETEENAVCFSFSLRSNIVSALFALEEKLKAFFSRIPCEIETSGHYPPWEFRENSPLRDRYSAVYERECGKKVKIEAIHAGLECGVFVSALPDMDAIAIGPTLLDVHTVEERMSLSSAEKIYGLVISLLKESK